MASGDTLLEFFPEDGHPGDADFATFDTYLTTSADEPDAVVTVLDFDPGATEEYIYFRGVMPRHYDGGGLTLSIDWTSEATTGDVIWSAALKSTASGVNMLTAAFAAPNDSAAATTNGTARVKTTTTITFTDGADMDSVAAGEEFWIEFHRSSADANDTMNSNDAEFNSMEIQET